MKHTLLTTILKANELFNKKQIQIFVFLMIILEIQLR